MFFKEQNSYIQDQRAEQQLYARLKGKSIPNSFWENYLKPQWSPAAF